MSIRTAAPPTAAPTDALAAALIVAGHPAPVLDPATALEPAVTPGPDGDRRAVVLLDDWTPALAARLSDRAWETASTWVPVRLDGGLVLVGPVLRPRAGTCLACAEQARLRVFGPGVPGRDPQLRLGGTIPPSLLPIVAGIVGDALADPDRLDGAVVAIRTDHATVSSHRVRPRRQGCRTCRPLPLDTPHGAEVPLTATPTGDPYSLRGDNPRTSRAALRAELFDWRHGPVAHMIRTERSPMALSTSELSSETTVREAGYGRARSFAESERIALFEAVERATGMRPYRRRTAVEASFAELGPQRAVDPARLGLHDPAYHDHPAFRMVPYTPQTRTRWVYGWSLAGRRPVLVPEHVAYWGLHRGDGPRFLYESSNGCGLGNSAVEAALYGMYEVAERDAFLMAWYAQTPLRPVAVPDADPVLPHLVDRLDTIGYDLLFFDATNDLGVPTVLALVLHRDPASGAPQAFFAAGTHPDPRAALRSAAAEAVVDVFSLPEVARNKPGHLDPDRLAAMFDDPRLVTGLEEHVAVNTLPQARQRYEFLLTGGDAPAHWRDVWPDRPAPVTDLAVLLGDTVEQWAARGLEVIVVDQTDPVVRDRLGLHSAKVIVPGTLPMTFGHVHHRTRGLDRLLRVPAELGRLPAPLCYTDLSLHPHPFP
ncbi:TOMM precursor leader peptide-binding protein [Micromonospora sp. NBC_01813]|uniref:TOMM precursor leader peptide-binding protein n=1 Tax=Micromonospora sp. NBC_01813 TaxID=2975988 RepID=UPI002DD9F7E0|nr:TOMM precursor leader peptide-binding protein [Micromonospora sp. NBC_01813]WSA11851.1 TOMM precursor leader peptide-binding protein [Micromonospora sp. NBC_01813]